MTDDGDNETGEYSLHLQRTNGPGAATPISFGDTLTAGGFTSGAEADAFTFAGTTGDRVFLRMSAGPVDPQLRLYRPDGSALCNGQAFNLLELSCILDATGTFTLLATDDGGNETGSYSLYLQRTNGPGAATPISFGDTLTAGGFTSGAEADAFTFAGTTGDRVFLRMSAGPVDPQLRLYRPDGSPLCNGQAFNLLELSCILDVTGTFTLLATDDGGNETGNYSLHLQRTNAPGNAISINFGDSLNGGIATAAELDAYIFGGSAGNQARFTMTWTSGTIDPKFRVYRPDGSELCSAETLGTTAQALCALDVTGTYAILAGDRSGTATGLYTLSLQSN